MNQHINLELFCVCFDQRLKDWYNSEDDMFFPWSPDYTLSFVVRGTANAEDTLNMRFRVYEGTNYSNATNNKNLIIDSIDNEVNTNSTGFFYTQINTANHLPKPAKENFVDEYTAELSIDGKVLETRLFQIACLPTDVNRVVKPIQLSYDPYFKKQGKESMPISLTFRHLNKDNFYIVMGAYYAYLTEDEELFEKPGNIMPAFDFQVLNLYADDDTATITFHLGADPDRKYYGKEPYLVFTVAGKTFLKCPLSKIRPQTSEEELEPFIVADEQPTEDGDGPILMPDGFANLLDYLDRRRVFDTNRPGSPIEWKRRHLVLTGKKGTGKRTAAQRLGKKLVEDGTAQDIAELNAIDMLDPTNGYSPKVEETLDSNADNLLVINNAEALALKGAVGSLTGIEILANKLLKMKNITVVLLGGKGRMEELIKMCEPARELFYTFYDFDDVEPEVMTRLSVKWLKDMNFRLEEEARKKLFHYFERAYSLRGMNFANMYMARQTIDDEILPRLVRRTISTEQLQPFAPPPLADMNLIVADDIPQAEERDPSVPLKKLESLIGLDNVKQSIINHTSLVRLNKIRADRGFYNRMPPMHMVFTGNPGTGKTTIAEYLGEIYRGIGALSSGHLVQTDRSKLVGQYIGDTEKNTLNAIQRASGGVLFIDEAYNLFVKSDDNRDFGMRVIETLLTYLSLEETDMIVILAGYTNEMKRMIESNPGLKSRFSYFFHFDDYSPDQLLRIGKLVLDKEQYHLTDEAERALSQYIIDEYNQKDEHFGNGRFVTRLLKSHIIPAMSQRLNKLPAEQLTDEMLKTIELCDIPRHDGLQGKLGPIDESILKSALHDLDQLVGVEQAKQALHGYVTTVRMERQTGSLTASSKMLYWNFIGNTGTGKSTVAELLGRLMQGLGLLKRGHTVTLNIEELNSRDMYDTLEKALKRATDGLLFMDMDSPRYRNQPTDSIRTWLVNKIKETKQQTAIVFAEVGESNDDVLRQLALNGFASLYHSVIFDDFTAPQLMQLLRQMLSSDYRLTLSAEADEYLTHYVENLHRQATRNSPVNARTIQMHAQTMAQSARLRIAGQTGQTNEVTLADLQEIEQQRSLKTSRIGF